MEKKIHYCWFGGKKLPRDVKKCIKTWKKMLPDYEIKEWNENNFDINICPFVKEAYENKKWAFVSDYARIYALYKEGGIYLDTDVKIIKDISHITDKDMFLGLEDSGFIGTAVIGVKEKNNKYLEEILEYYNKIEHFNIESIYNYANPVIITNILNKYPSEVNQQGIKIYDNKIYIYPRDYFYPLSYNYTDREYTENTCMVHLFNATWTSIGERRTVYIYRKFGINWGEKLNNLINTIGNLKYSIITRIKKMYLYFGMKYSIHMNWKKRVARITNELKKIKDKYITICNPEWKESKEEIKNIFGDNIVDIREQYTEKEANLIAQAIVNSGKKLVIFDSFANGWEKIIIALKKINPEIIIKILIHGGNTLLIDPQKWYSFNLLLELYQKGKIDELGFLKKSLYEFYKTKGYNASFIMNDIVIEDKEKYIPEQKNNEQLRIGLYVLDDSWIENTYNQLSAISLFENVKLDSMPINYKISTMARRYNVNITGQEKGVSLEDEYKRIAQNDIIYM